MGINVIVEPFSIIGLPPIGTANGELETVIGDNAHVRSHTVIYAGNVIGSNFQTGHHVTVRASNRIGNDVSIGTAAEIAYDVTIGSNVRIHSGCRVFEHTVIESNSRIGPNVTILHTKYPGRKVKKYIDKAVVIRDGAIIGGSSTVLPNIEIGSNSLVGAGSLVTRDVPPFAVVYGHPAVVTGDIREIIDEEGEHQYKF